MNKELLKILNLGVGFGGRNNDSLLFPPVNASAGEGELIALIGRNGIGKSTFLRTVTGLQTEKCGEVEILGKKLGDYPKRLLAGCVGYISTEPVRVENMSVRDLVSLGRYPHTGWTGRLTEKDDEAIESAIVNAGLTSLRNRNINELSDGERQRAMIARVLSQDTPIVIMDEPTAFLDIRSRYEIVHLLHELTRSEKKTIIFSTHDFAIAAGECDKIWLFLEDRFVEGAPEDIILNGEIDNLFGDSVVSFNRTDGSFSFLKPLKGIVNLSGEGEDFQWTRKALNRAGYDISDLNAKVFVKIVHNDSGRKWKVKYGETAKEFVSVYDLVNFLDTL